MIENWKTIQGYPDYEVSDLGRIRRVRDYRKHKAGLVLKPCLGSNGYSHVTLCCDSVQTQFDIHRLVITTFSGPPPTPQHEVNHKNLKKPDNRLVNLEWVTQSENSLHFQKVTGWVSPFSHLDQRGERHPLHKLTTVQVEEIRTKLKSGSIGAALAREYGVEKTTIYRIRDGRNWK